MTEAFNYTSSWLTNGDCTTCRRRKYCNKECKLHKQRKDNMVRAVIYKHASMLKFTSSLLNGCMSNE